MANGKVSKGKSVSKSKRSGKPGKSKSASLSKSQSHKLKARKDSSEELSRHSGAVSGGISLGGRSGHVSNWNVIPRELMIGGFKNEVRPTRPQFLKPKRHRTFGVGD